MTIETLYLNIHLRMTMSVLEMGHQGEPLSLHPVTPGPQTGDVIRPEGAVRPDRVIFNLLRRLE